MAPSAALAARLGPPQRHYFNEVAVTGRHGRPGDQVFLKGSVACMARDPTTIFTAEEVSAVVDSARALLVELSEERLLSVDWAWRLIWHDGWET